jgi:hypothetical protein
MEWYKNEVNDKSTNVTGGKQQIQTKDGYMNPLIIKDGLARLDICPHTGTKQHWIVILLII